MIPRKRRVKKAKYNGISFYIEEDEMCSGRRILTHEFPFSEVPATEDLGKKAKQWNIQGFVGGALCKQEAEKLQDALEQPGVGILDHPFIGKNKKVRCPNYRRIETSREWGVIWFSITFVEAGELPQIAVNSIVDQTKKNQTFLEDAFSSFQSHINEGAHRLAEASDSIDSFVDSLEESIAPYVHLRESLSDVTSSLSGLKDLIREITSEPSRLFHAFTETLESLVKSPLDSLSLLQTLSGSMNPLLSAMSTDELPYAGKPVASQIVSESLSSVMLIYMSQVAKKNDVKNTFKRDRVKSIFLSSCDHFLEKSLLTSFFEVVQTLRSETYFTLQRQDEERSIRVYRTPGDTNIILLSYDIYGDALRADQIIQLNPTLDPTLIPKDITVEIAS